MFNLRNHIKKLLVIDKHRKAIILKNSQYSDDATKLYIQGQSPESKVREYFYYIDHEGMVNIYNSITKQNTH